MRDDLYLGPGPAGGAGGVSDHDLVLNPRPYEPDTKFGDDALRLDPKPRDPPRRRWRPSKGALLLGGWAAVLVAAVGVAYLTQPDRNLGTPEAPPAVAPASSEDIGQPMTAPSIASDPARFVQATSAPEINPPEPPDAEAGPGEVQIAEAAPTSQPATMGSAAVEPSPAKPEPAKAEVVAGKVKPAKSVTATAKLNAARAELAKVQKAVDKPKATDAKDLPQLKVRMTRAYAEAVRAGTPKSVLKARQAQWAVLRAKAERKGPSAVAALYRSRAAQLEAIARKSGAHGRTAALAAPQPRT